MRQDIDVAMVGEIRDSLTANAALQLSETGHLLLSTVHTSSAIETLSRITGILTGDYRLNGIYVMASQIKGIVNQKLIPRVCPHCGVSHKEHKYDEFDEIKERVLESDFLTEDEISSVDPKIGSGCDKCKGRRFLGRVLLPDFIGFEEDEDMRAQLLKYLIGEDSDIRKLFQYKSVKYLPREKAAFELLKQGVITLDQYEGIRLTSSSH
jgi:type II secretory ATPase GspE/PulE/Tfp pilus assembly ATPase PilB-like protein